MYVTVWYSVIVVFSSNGFHSLPMQVQHTHAHIYVHTMKCIRTCVDTIDECVRDLLPHFSFTHLPSLACFFPLLCISLSPFPPHLILYSSFPHIPPHSTSRPPIPALIPPLPPPTSLLPLSSLSPYSLSDPNTQEGDAWGFSPEVHLGGGRDIPLSSGPIVTVLKGVRVTVADQIK